MVLIFIRLRLGLKVSVFSLFFLDFDFASLFQSIDLTNIVA